MKVYLMRHAHPDPGERMDASRGITPRGVAQAKAMRDFLEHIGVEVDLIITSKFARAIETAEIMSVGRTPVRETDSLDPDGNTSEAWEDIHDIAKDWNESARILVVTHAPLLTQIAAAVVFQLDPDDSLFSHGSMMFINTDAQPAEGDDADAPVRRMRWFVTPKAALQLMGKDTQKVTAIDAIETAMSGLREHLLLKQRSAVVDPLIGKLRVALSKRFRKQHKILKRNFNPNISPAWMSLRFATKFMSMHEPNLGKVYAKATASVYQSGQDLAAAQLGASSGAAVREAEKPSRSVENLENEIDATSLTRLAQIISQAQLGQGPVLYEELLAQVKDLYDQWADGTEGQVSRAETIATTEISQAYHSGMSDAAKQWAGGNGPVEKAWSVQPDACPNCEANADEGWIDYEAPFTSGDFEPPLHPSCRCSLDYRPAEVTEAALR